jgi:bacillithiol system protein YtxJ
MENRWQELKTVEEWDRMLAGTDKRPALVLKHSTTCPVSANGYREYEEFMNKFPDEDIDYVLVKVIESRPVSNKIAEDLKVKHESPQVILVKNREPYWNASHWSITSEHIEAVVK